MKLLVLPYGQYALNDQPMNFPVNTSEICNLLQKTLGYAGIVLVAPSKIDNPDSMEVQNYYSVHRSFRALQWLQQHNSLYRDIEVIEFSDDESHRYHL